MIDLRINGWWPVNVCLPRSTFAVICFVVDYRTVLAINPRPLEAIQCMGWYDDERQRWYDDMNQPLQFVKGWQPQPAGMPLGDTELVHKGERYLY